MTTRGPQYPIFTPNALLNTSRFIIKAANFLILIGQAGAQQKKSKGPIGHLALPPSAPPHALVQAGGGEGGGGKAGVLPRSTVLFSWVLLLRPAPPPCRGGGGSPLPPPLPIPPPGFPVSPWPVARPHALRPVTPPPHAQPPEHKPWYRQFPFLSGGWLPPLPKNAGTGDHKKNCWQSAGPLLSSCWAHWGVFLM